MLRRYFSSLRFRLLLLVLLAVIPLFGLVIYNAFEARQSQTELVGDQVSLVARLASSSVANIFEGERQLLVAISRLPAVAVPDLTTCDAALADLLALYPFYANLSAVAITGDTYCSGVPQPDGFVNVRDQQFFRRALESRDFAVDDFSIDRLTGVPVLAGAYPLYINGSLFGVVTAALKLEHLDQLAAAAALPEGATLNIVDNRATVLSRYPDPEMWVGQTWEDMARVIEARIGGAKVVTATGLDGVERLYGFETVAGTGSASVYVSVGIPTEVAYAGVFADLRRNLAGLAAVSLLALIAAWIGSGRLVILPVERLAAVTQRLASGDLSARAGGTRGPGELNQLAQSFDTMADALAVRQTRLTTVNRMLRMLSECNQALVRAVGEPDLLDSVARNIVQFGGYAVAWVSLVLPGSAAPRLAALAGGGVEIHAGLEPVGRADEPAPSLAAEALHTGRAVVVHDLAGQPARAALHQALAPARCAALVALPLALQGQPLGALCLGAVEASAFTDEEIRLLEELAGDLAYGLTALRTDAAREQAEAQVHEGAERTRALADLSRALAAVTTDTEAVARAAVRHAVERVGDGAVLKLVSTDRTEIRSIAHAHRNPEAAALLGQLLSTASMQAEAGLSGRVIASDQPLLVTSASPVDLNAAYRTEHREFLDRFTVSCLLIVPLRAQATVIGTLSLSRQAPGEAYSEAEQGFLQAIADRAALAISNARLYETARQLNTELEQRVSERTAQLAASNEALAGENADRRHAEAQVRQLNATLLQRAAALEAANRELEAFSYSVSHDLRAPLRGIDGFSLALLEEYSDRLDDAGRDYLRRVRAAAQRMAALIDDMIDLSRVARAELRWQPVDLTALAQEIAAELRPTQPERRAEFVIQPGLSAQGDGRLLRLALDNLFGNAWKFTARREATRIEFGQAQNDGQMVYFVRDNGAGFNMAYADRLFGAFQRLHDQKEYPGTGIGLATVQRIIARHGGRVWAEGEVGVGATFFFVLSADPQAADRAVIQPVAKEA